MNSVKEINTYQGTYGVILWGLLGLFCFRVIAQLIQSNFSMDFLPAFEAWHSGALPYHYLVITQILIIFLYVYICIRFTNKNVVPNRKLGNIFLFAGLIYAGIMFARLLIGVFVSSSTWFHAYLPIFFHFVLAAFLIIVGMFHLKFYKFYEKLLAS